MRVRYKTRNGTTVDIRYDGAFLEEEHPRGKDGKFIAKHDLALSDYNKKLLYATSPFVIKRILWELPVGTVAIGNDSKAYKKQADGSWKNGKKEIEPLELTYLDKLGKWELPKAPQTPQNKATEQPYIAEQYETMLKEKYGNTDYYSNLAKHMGVSREEAERIEESIRLYTDDAYVAIKGYERSGIKSLEDYDVDNIEQIWQDINRGIDLLPKVEEEIWRGTYVTNKDMGAIKQGNKVRLNGVSSFTTQRKTASDFAIGGARGETPIVFKLGKGLHRGTHIDQFSANDGEGEVLMHSEATFTITGTGYEDYIYNDSTRQILTVYLEEDYE